MEELKTQAIVLKSIDFKEGAKLLTLFSLENGLITAKINGVSKPKAKLAFAGQPFCFGEYIIVSKAGKTVINCTAIENFYDLSCDFDKYIAGSAILEIVSILAREDEPNPQLFVLLLKSLKTLTYTKAQPLAVYIKFLVEAMAISGYKMELSKCAVCGNENSSKEKFSFALGARVCVLCSGVNTISISSGEVAVMKNIDMTGIERLESLKFSSLDNLMSVVKIFNKYFTEKTGERLTTLTDYI